MDENDLIDLVKADVEDRDKPPPASAADIAALEGVVSYPMPPLLRRIYLEVADGGFGYLQGALSVAWHPGCKGRVIDWYENFRLPRLLEASDGYGDEMYIHPRSVVPLAELGCAMWVLVDFATPDGRTWGYNPNRGCDRHYLYPEPHTIADRLLDWLREDNRLNNWRPKLNRHCKACRDGM